MGSESEYQHLESVSKMDQNRVINSNTIISTGGKKLSSPRELTKIKCVLRFNLKNDKIISVHSKVSHSISS